jgi:hypothetical protein
MMTSKPNFLIIGAPKAATTTLASMFLKHPQSCFAECKEIHFFSMDEEYARGWEWYLGHFKHCSGRLAIGEASTSYSRIRDFPEAARRISMHLPNVKIIYMVRNPMQRIESAYIEWHRRLDIKHTLPSISEAVHSIPTIVNSSRYWEVYSHYRRFVDESHIRIVWFEEFVADTTAGFQNVCSFLGIDSDTQIEPNKQHRNSREQLISHLQQQSPVRPPDIELTWTPESRNWVEEQLADDSRTFLDYFGKPPDYWSNPST